MSDSIALPKFKPLFSSNYTTWSGGMRTWLMRGGYWMLIKGEKIKPGNLVEGKLTTDKSSATLAWSIKAGKSAVDSIHTAYLSGHVVILSLTPAQSAHLFSVSTLLKSQEGRE
ncbi:hypothetical protein NLI96_g11553 [Meripilus lineatus]|uniref:DUF4219 domain-containing protein n=1 Tax=Meripilus lineatus TaxID=2056292 RepID=A0AAD5URJ3_9APHY|nr:hypothetical protein NLI96_g11553 [Physisporinus lineatus]